MNRVYRGFPHEKVNCRLAWFTPLEGFIKLNTDGSFKNYSGLAGAGGVVRNSQGSWLLGFVVNLGKSNCFMDGTWGILHLLLIKKLDFEKVFAESVSALIVSWV